MIIATTSPTYSVTAHDDLLQKWEALPAAAEPLQIDLRSVQFIDPYGMCALVLFIHHLPPEVLPVRLLLKGWPIEEGNLESSGPVSYLTRMGFWQALGDKLDNEGVTLPEKPDWSIDRNVLLEIVALHTHDAIHEVLQRTGEILRNLSYTAPARGHVLEVLSELCSNVLMHAQAPSGCIAAMQTYRSREGSRYLVIGIGDSGIGVRRSLAANQKLSPRLQSDAVALAVAVQPGTSRFAVGGHGGGLPRVLDIAKRYEGRVAMRSGTGALTYIGADRKTLDAPPLVGTHLRISLPEVTMRNERQGDLLTPEEG